MIKKKTYNLGEYKFNTLNNLTKEELLEVISCLNNNIRAVEEQKQIIYRRAKKLTDYLENQGLPLKEINQIMKLEGENY